MFHFNPSHFQIHFIKVNSLERDFTRPKCSLFRQTAAADCIIEISSERRRGVGEHEMNKMHSDQLGRGLCSRIIIWETDEYLSATRFRRALRSLRTFFDLIAASVCECQQRVGSFPPQTISIVAPAVAANSKDNGTRRRFHSDPYSAFFAVWAANASIHILAAIGVRVDPF